MQNGLTGTLPTELGNLDVLEWLCVRNPHRRMDACANTGVWAERGGGCACRHLAVNGLTGTLPTELGNLDVLGYLCVRHPHRRMDACAVTGSWAERGVRG
jgi:hypothetical protein